MPDISTVLAIVGAALTSVIGLLAVIAPLTKSDKDDRLLRALRWVENALLKILLPGRSVK